MKKFISLIITLLLVFTVSLEGFVLADEAILDISEEVSAPVVTEEVKMLKKLGVFDADISGEQSVTRAAMLVPMLRLAGILDISASENMYSFNDVDLSHKHASYVYTAKNAGYINGDGNGNFSPDDNAEFNAAVKLMVSVAGFSAMADAKGGYPAGYIAVANSKKMLSGITSQEMQTLTYDVLAKLIANSLEVYTAETTLIENGEAYNVVGDEMLISRLGLEKIEGIVTHNEYTSLKSASMYDATYAVIGDVMVNPADSGIGRYLGYNVYAYVAKNAVGKEKKVVYVCPEDNNVLTVSSDEITDIGFDKTTFEYEVDGKIKDGKLEKYFTFIYNGLACKEYNDKLLNSGYGNTTFIDNDHDNTYDIVSVEAYYDIVVNEVSGGVISNKLGSGIDLNDSSTQYLILKDNEVVSADSLMEWDSLLVVDSSYNLVYPNDERIITLYVSDERAMGVASESYIKNGKKYITIEGSSYEISKTLEQSESLGASVPTLGSEGTFIINAKGKIAAFSVSSLQRAMAQYAYLTGVDTSDGLTQKSSFKMYTTDEEFIVAEAADYVLIDGISYRNELAADALGGEAGFVPQLICYRLNSDEKISYIDTEKRTSRENGFTLNKTYDGTQSGLLTYKSGYRTFADRIHISDDTLIFCVPAENPNDENLYGLSDYTTFKNDQRYDVVAYNTDDSSLACGALVYRGDVSQDMEESNLCIIERIYRALDENENDVEFLKGYDCYGEVILKSGSNAFSKAGFETGDIINYSSNAKSEMVDYKLIYDCSEDYFNSPSNPTGDFTVQYRKMYGLVYYKSGTKFRICTGDPTEVTDISTLEIKDIRQFRNAYTYDIEEEIVTKAEPGDLKDWLSIGDECTRVILSQGYGDNTSIILYK